MQRKVSLIKSLDWFTITLYLLLVTIGCFAIYAAGYDFEQTEIFNLSMKHCLQLVWVGTAFILALLVLLLDNRFYSNMAYLLYAAMIVLLVVTIFISPDVKGSHSWIKLGSFSIQPAEFAKYTTALCLSKFMSTYQFNLTKPRNIAIIASIIGLPALIIIAQSETGSALVFVSFLLMLFREGMNGAFLLFGFFAALFFVLVLRYNNLPIEATPGMPIESYGYLVVFILAVIITAFLIYYYTNNSKATFWYSGICGGVFLLGSLLRFVLGGVFSYTLLSLVSLLAGVVFLLIYAIVSYSKVYAFITLFLLGSVGLSYMAGYAFDQVLEPHQQIRIKVVLGLEDDPQGAGYNVRQSQIAIGSGGLAGKGFLKGTQTKLNYVPEQHTDFIFCTIGEEQGFVGTTTLIVLYCILLIRLTYLAERQRSPFSRIYGYSVVGIMFFHFCINIGMVIGLVPVIGIPLPLVSYGGSGMWGFTLLLFTFLRLDASRTEEFR